MDKLQYVYTKRRMDYGRQSFFNDRATEIDVNLPYSKEVASQFISKNPANASTGIEQYVSEHVANTNYVELDTVGLNHTEGGWPKDINANDVDMTTRYRKKSEKDEIFVQQLSRISQEMEHYILQTSAVDIYERYFDENCPTHQQPPVSLAKAINMFRDHATVPRPVAQIVWHPDGPEKFAVAHCILSFQGHLPSTSLDCYVWRTDDLLHPDLVLHPFAPILSLRYNPKDIGILAGGQYNGQVVIWDVRKGSRPIDKTELSISHTDPTYDVTWVQSKVGTEFFSTSTDGQVIWWDTRNLSESVDRMYIDATKKNDPKTAEGGTCLEYDVTAPTKFMVGTEQGSVFMCTRKAKTPGEKVTTVYSKAHIGPIYSLKRNPIFSKYFLTVGDWTVKVWSEECKDSPIMWTPYGSRYLTDGCWSPVRPSVFFVTRMDGSLDIWDLIFRQKSPEYSVKLSDSPLQCVSAQEQGQLMCVGTQDGRVIVLKLSEGLSIAHRNGKQIFNAILERETRREKILEGRERERKLAQKQKAEEGEDKKQSTQTPTAEVIDAATKAFFEEVNKEKDRLEKETKKIAADISKAERASELRRSHQFATPPPVAVMGGEVKAKEHFKIDEEDPDRYGKTGAQQPSQRDQEHPAPGAAAAAPLEEVEEEEAGKEIQTTKPEPAAETESETPLHSESAHHPQTDAIKEEDEEEEKPGQDKPPAGEETPTAIPEIVGLGSEKTSAADLSSGQSPAGRQVGESDKIDVPDLVVEAPSTSSINAEQNTDD